MSEIALAYSSIDKSRGEAVAKVLGALGYTVAPQPLTAAQVEACKALIVFWSSGSVNSLPINQFAQQASLQKKLVSVRAGHADPPAAFALVALHDLSRWTGSLEAPELRTFLQHLLRKAPPASAPPQPNFAGALPARAPAPAGTPFNFAGPMGASMRPEAQRAAQLAQQQQQRQAPPATPAAAAAPVLTLPPQPPPRPQPAPTPVRPPAADDRQSLRNRPSTRRAEERRRAAGGGAARVAFGAIAVSVIAGAAVAAFNYEPGKQTAAAPQPPTDIKTTVAVAPNTFAASTANDAAAEAPVAAGVQVAAASQLPAPPATTETPAAGQAARAWTASLPTLPAVRSAPLKQSAESPPAKPRPAGAAVASGQLTPVDGPAFRPAPTDLVAVDNADFGEPDNALVRRAPEDYGPER